MKRRDPKTSNQQQRDHDKQVRSQPHKRDADRRSRQPFPHKRDAADAVGDPGKADLSYGVERAGRRDKQPGIQLALIRRSDAVDQYRQQIRYGQRVGVDNPVRG